MALWTGKMWPMCSPTLVSSNQIKAPGKSNSFHDSGQDSSAAVTSRFFPPGSRDAVINFPTFLNMLSSMISSLSSAQELANALAAFDEDDSGQIDVDELREALLQTTPDGREGPLTVREINEVLKGFTGRRMFGAKNSKRGDVFRYHEFVAAASGGSGEAKG